MNKSRRLRALALSTAVVAQIAPVSAQAAQPQAAAEKTTQAVANVQGTFSFDQNVVSPADTVFNLFGTVATGLCAKPGFAFEKAGEETVFVNVGGRVKKQQTYSLGQLKRRPATTRSALCACSTGGATAQASITGVPVAEMLQVAGVDEAANAISFRSADGYTQTLPLSYVLEKDAMLVYRIGDKDIPEGTQVWMPGTVASYFTRQVVDIELLKSDQVPSVRKMPDEYRAQVSFVNSVEESFHVGDRIGFEGYADDLGSPIRAVEFSMDGGKTWTTYETRDTTAEKWVYWRFEFDAAQAGSFRLNVRARTADGTVSPLAASVDFRVSAL